MGLTGRSERIRRKRKPKPGAFDGARLRRAVEAALADPTRGQSVEVVERRLNPYASSFSSEILSYRLTGDEEGEPYVRERVTLVKSSTTYVVGRIGSVRGVPAEVAAYRDVLPALPVARPDLMGHFEERGPDPVAWLFIEYLGGAVRLDQMAEGGRALVEAARELAALHEAGRSRVTREGVPPNRYHGPYLERWTERWRDSAMPLADDRRWMRGLVDNVRDIVSPLDEREPTVVHGEAYPNNVLMSEGRAFLIDWESLGIGAGELDLATLLLSPSPEASVRLADTPPGWAESSVREATDVYVQSRWPSGAPEDFAQVLQAARFHTLGQLMHYHLWFGGRPERLEWILTEMQVISEQLGVV